MNGAMRKTVLALSAAACVAAFANAGTGTKPTGVCTNAEEWTRDIRPRVVKFFDENVYGALPPKPAKLSFELVEHGPAFGGAAERRQYSIRSTDALGEFAFDVLLYLPAGKSAVPAFVYPNFSGNHSLVGDPAVRVFGGHARGKRRSARGERKDRAPVEKIVRGGFAFATFCYGAVYPDYTPSKRDAAPESVWRIFPPTAKPEEILAHPTWSWGTMRVRDLLETLPEIDQTEFIACIAPRALINIRRDGRPHVPARAVPQDVREGGTCVQALRQVHRLAREERAALDHGRGLALLHGLRPQRAEVVNPCV